MYRFRNIKHLLDDGELENQEIYFSDISALNDPIEGYREICWKGDSILWKNLIKHYLLCLENVIVLTMLSEDQVKFSQQDIPVFMSTEKLPTELYKNMFQEICNEVLNNEGIIKYTEYLSSRLDGVNHDELFIHLKMIHMIACEAIIKIHAAHSLQLASNKPSTNHSDSLTKLLTALEELQSGKEEHINSLTLFSMMKQFMRDNDILSSRKSMGKGDNNKQCFIKFEFPAAYIEQIESLTYPNLYVACFTEDCTNPVTWSHYGDSHKGVALQFKPQLIENEPCINLYGITGVWGNGKNSYSKRKYPFKKVTYSNEFPKINFFTSLGQLTVPQALSQWYTDVDGKQSTYASDIFNKQDEWRHEYWAKFEKSVLTKLNDWEKEVEFRLILPEILGLHTDINARKFKYDFNDLGGIVFGIKTPLETKSRIIDIIEEKCKKIDRKDFEYYQAQYDESAGKINIIRMSINQTRSNKDNVSTNT